MTNKNYIIIILTLLTLSVGAQNNYIGIKGGLNLTNVFVKSTFNDKVYKMGYSGGMTYETIFKNNFSLCINLQYNQLGFGNYFIFEDSIDPVKGSIPGTGGRKILFFNYDYLTLPVKVGYYFGGHFFGFGYFGVTPSYLIAAKTNVEGYPTSTDNTNAVTKFDIGGQIELGCGFEIKKRYAIYSSILYQQSFTTLSNSKYWHDSNIRNFGFIASVGLKYNLTKKNWAKRIP
ncbi:MAG: hypothetical protein Q8M15_13885 [Bacteroidota bacterium]|nr:hypothetical protein [Bacteroidota bacterium]